jgi:hypothetical protein
MILPVPRSRPRWIAGIATIRVLTFLSGWALAVTYGDWRQLVGYPLLLIGALPDALFIRYIIRPQSPVWPAAMVASLVLSSAIVVALLRRGGRVPPRR